MSRKAILPILGVLVCGFIITGGAPGSMKPLPLYGQEKIDGKKDQDKKGNADARITKGEGLDEELKKNKKLKLTIEKVVEYLLRNNNDVKRILLEHKGASSELMDFRSKYDTKLYGNTGYAVMDTPNKDNFALYGKTVTTGNAALGIEKQFSTGTTVNLGLTGIYQRMEGAAVLPAPFGNMNKEGYQAGVKIDVRQELLKNFMGFSDRLTERKISNAEKMNKQLTKYKLAGLLVEAIIGYWNVAIAEMNLETWKKNLDNTINIRNLIARNLSLGLSEREDIFDWDGRVLQSRNSYDRSEKFLFDSRLAVYRILDLDSGLDVEIGRIFRTTPPDVEYNQALKNAFLKRIDWNNYLTVVKNAELEYRIAYSELLPSLKLRVSAGNQDYDKSYAKTYDTFNRDYYAGIELSVPLENTKADVRLRNARLGFQKVTVEQKALEKLIRDEVASLVKDCTVNFKVYEQTKKSREFAQDYYYQVYNKFRRGKYNAVQLKLAQDSLIFAEQEELKNLISYNISLLKRDMSQNVIFEKLGIDIDAILKRLEN